MKSLNCYLISLCATRFATILYVTILLLMAMWMNTAQANAHSQTDCGMVDGIQLPCTPNYIDRDSDEGRESLPYYPYAKRPNGCSIWPSKPGTHDTISLAGINIKFTDICNKHDRCYYTLGTTPWECNDPFQSSLRGRCEREINDHALNGYDFITLGRSRKAVLIACYTKATVMGLAVIGSQSEYHSIAQKNQEEYEAEINCYIKKVSDSPMHTLYVDATTVEACKSGHEQTPYDRICLGIKRAKPEEIISIRAGSYSEIMTIRKAITLTAFGGTVTIGADSNPERCLP